MAYTVLARKYRSRTFDEVIGQKPIATTLVNAINAGRIHHGYLFTGTRGVGKTSLARILAKALNCLKFDAPTATPCCQCESCTAIAEGQDIDVVEIDAASNTGVDNIRELRSNAAYRPARARFKIYIIDEVHMLSTGAFNALLKTLEEPPGHVKFILATTEIQKVPATIQSRCQRFNFRHIGPDEIAESLARVCREEGAEVDDAVVRRVARLANGSMRDALSILDQLLSLSPKKLSATVLDEVLPPAQDEQVFALFKHAAEGDVAGAVTMLDAILNSGRGLDVFCQDALETARALMLLRAAGPQSELADVPAGQRDAYAALAAGFELSQYVQMIAMFEELRRNARISGAGRALADAAVVRLARMNEWSSIEQLLAGGPGAAAEKKKLQPVGEPRPAAITKPAAAVVPAPPVSKPAAPAVAAPVRDRPEAGPPVAMRNGRHEPASGEQRRASILPIAESLDDESLPADVHLAAASAGAAAAAEASEALAPSSGPDLPLQRAPDELPPEAVGGPRAAVQRRTATVEERRRIEADPLVRYALERLDGTIVNLERELPGGAAAVEPEDGPAGEAE